LEVGCGAAALVSQCAALCGFKVVMTDFPHVLEWACENVRRNIGKQWMGHPHLEESLLKSEPGSVSPLLSSRTLRWGEASDLPTEPFDLVVAADCLYAPTSHEDGGDNNALQDKLLLTLQGLLANGRTKLLVSYQNRTGQERIFVHETLLAVLPDNYVVDEIHSTSSKGAKISEQYVHAMAWVRPKGCENVAVSTAAADGGETNRNTR
jgi:hypothetical protein